MYMHSEQCLWVMNHNIKDHVNRFWYALLLSWKEMAVAHMLTLSLLMQFCPQQLHQLCSDAASALRWLAQHGLIHNELWWAHGNIAMPLQMHARGRFMDGYCWACWQCQQQKQVTCDLFFAGSPLMLVQLIDIIYWWSHQVRQVDTCMESGVSAKSMVDWQNFINDVCCQYLLDHQVQIGGPGWTVEIDESKFMHWKYHQGHYCKGHWVLRMVECGMNIYMMIAVEDCSVATLLPLIAQHVLPGTHIITDGWQAYNQLPLPHDIVNHQLNFVDLNDLMLHTNTIEGLWALCKAKYHAMHSGTSDALFHSHLQEFLWHCVHQDMHLWKHTVLDLPLLPCVVENAKMGHH